MALLRSFDFYRVSDVLSPASNSRILVDVSFLALNTVTFHLLYKAISVLLSVLKWPPVCNGARHSTLSPSIVLGAINTGTRRVCSQTLLFFIMLFMTSLLSVLEKRRAIAPPPGRQTHLPASTPDIIRSDSASRHFLYLLLFPSMALTLAVYKAFCLLLDLYLFIYFFVYVCFSMRRGHPTFKWGKNCIALPVLKMQNVPETGVQILHSDQHCMVHLVFFGVFQGHVTPEEVVLTNLDPVRKDGFKRGLRMRNIEICTVDSYRFFSGHPTNHI